MKKLKEIINAFLDWLEDIGVCYDCGDYGKIVILPDTYVAYHDIYIDQKNPYIKKMGVHEQQLCLKCYEALTKELPETAHV